MTDEAAGGAVAPAESNSAPIDTNQTPQSQPLGSQTPDRYEEPAQTEPKPDDQGKDEAKKPEDGKKEPSKSVRDALKKATEEVKAKREADAKAKADAPKEGEDGKPAAKSEKADEKPQEQSNRAPDGKFQAREAAQEGTQQPEGQQAAQPQPQQSSQPSQAPEAPQRFDDQAKKDWATVPESVRGAVHRTIRELEQGHEKYKADAESWSGIAEFDQMARQYGTTVKDALTRYTNAEKLLAQDPVKGLENIASNMGISLRDIAAQIMGQSPDEVQSQNDATIRELRQQVSQQTEQIQQLVQHMQTQGRQQTDNEVVSFINSKDEQGNLKYPRVQELEQDMAFFIQNGRAETLHDAYQLAERLNPAPANAAHTGTTAPQGDQQPLAQTQTQPKPANPAGQKSVSGAPATGSDPVEGKKGPIPSTRDALKNAMRKAS